MKPLKLVISAFGPYKDKVEIDFSRLGESGVFLITGDTGSGKTTIFDALSFSLFGEASGSRRDNTWFRSDFANDDVETFVNLEFEHKGVFYYLERRPRYKRKKKRGDGFTLVGGDASLTYRDIVISGDNNVTDKCIEILGMNASQFKQIVMIAQGEFLELLFAKTKDRASIFRHIFDTSIYKNISDSLKNKYLLKKREYEDTAIAIKGYIQNIQLSEQLCGRESTDIVLKLLEREIKLDEDKEKGLDKERGRLSNEISKFVGIISEAKIINDSIVRLSQYKDKLTILLECKDEFNEKEELVKRNKDIWDLIMPKYIDLIETKKELEDKKVKLDKAVNDFQFLTVDFEKSLINFNCVKAKREEINRYETLIIENEKKLLLFKELSELDIQLVECNKRLLCYKLFETRLRLSKVKDYKRFEKSIACYRDKLVKLKDEYVRDNDNYVRNYDLFLSAQAGILASELKDGQACPVCGSTTHPSLAVKVIDVLSKEELDREKRNLDIKHQTLEDLRLELLEKENQLFVKRQEFGEVEEDVLIKELNFLENECDGIALELNSLELGELEEKIKSIEMDIKHKNNELSDEKEDILQGKISEFKLKVVELEKEVVENEEMYNQLFKEKTKFESLIAVLKEDIFKLESNCLKLDDEYVTCYKSLNYENESDYVEVKLDKDRVLELDNEFKKYKEDLFNINSNISSLEKVIDGREFIELDKFEIEVDKLNEQLTEVELSLKEINNKLFNNRKMYASIIDVSQKTKKLEKEVMIYKDLSDTANGTIAGKSKLEFEQYVQASYFDRVLLSANKRFSYMTDERYRLVRKEESSKISDKLGLELEVMDYYTGKIRDVKSLSGGESFKAALALALGMSDTIQEFSGGIVVEALFIDEGFGSLDEESLEQALNAIMLLGQENKMIGIISHVNELKARIDKKVVVKKSSSGSCVSLIV